MKLKCTIIIFLLLNSTFLIAQNTSTFKLKGNSNSIKPTDEAKNSQNKLKKSKKSNITGIWRGYFIQTVYNPMTGKFEEDRSNKYKYEIQINNLITDALEGVTYSYLNTTFYGKASLQGIFTNETQNILIKETKMLELKVTGFSQPCLMTCYLDYIKDGKKEILKGDYTSQNMRNKGECGDGIVYLEKVPDTEFEKEAFLIKPSTPLKKDALVKKETPKNTLANNKTSSTEKQNTNTLAKSRFKPGAEDALVKEKTTPKKENVTTIQEQKAVTLTKPKKETPFVKELENRKNNLIKTLYVNEGELLIELYDNGQIDNDTVSIYHNGNPVILKGRLSTLPLQIKINVSADEPIHELIMVADNLGTIPPNTALMLVTAGKKTYEVFLTSDLQGNAKIVFEYKPQNDAGKK
ncbi:MAG: hypothetical protein MUE72_07335 [Chitinophagaceae bacterium]|jgi:hypothetical protein|nr:hypothetical protein [Chitinophagaceae bacterium]